jgi:hypothetical protein
MGLKKLGVALAVAAAFAAPQSALAQTDVQVELALLVDVSGSVDSNEFLLQRNGYRDAFLNPVIQAAFEAGRTAAITVVYWSSVGQQSVVVPWTLINSAAAAASFANAIGATSRIFSGGTDPHAAINFVTPLFNSNSFDSLRQIIDVSGDGAGSASLTAAARNAALASGIDQINGLPILGESGLLAFYQNNIQGGANSFTEPAASFSDFGDAILLKLGREIVNPPDLPPVNPIPEPETYALMGAGLAALGFISRRRKNQKGTASA